MNKFDRAIRAALLGAAALFVAGTAQAAPVLTTTITDRLDVAATNGTSDWSGYSSATFANRVTNAGTASQKHWGDSVQSASDPFDTSKIEVRRDDTAKSITLDIFTAFNGNDLGAKYADIFLDTLLPTVPGSFNYAISLGSQTKAAGLYSISSYATSQDIWASQTNYVYGGYVQFKPGDANYDPNVALLAPVRLTGGTLVAGTSVSVNQIALADGTFDLRVTINAGSNLNLFNNFDLFWGTGDCSNDAIWGQVVTASVPAPGALALLALGLIGLVVIARRRAVSGETFA